MNQRSLLLLILLSCFCSTTVFCAPSIPKGSVDDNVKKIVYGDTEIMKFRVSWSGGVKIGELYMEIRKSSEAAGHYTIHSRVTDSGIFHFFYPVNDTFTTLVNGESCYPVRYDVEQREGRSYHAIRLTEYDQVNGLVHYRKNDQPMDQFQVAGKVHNEFSSFYFTRMLMLDPGKPVIVPTFADKERHDVVVQTGEHTRLSKTAVGDVNVIPVTPVMDFKGLYEKSGDTVIFLTDDICRIPVRIVSKVLVGSITADLVSYSNAGCPDQSLYHSEINENISEYEKVVSGD